MAVMSGYPRNLSSMSGRLSGNSTISGNINNTGEVNGKLAPFGLKEIYYDTTEGWNNQRFLIAERAVIYVYSDYATVDDKPVPAIKIGDGTSYLIDMPFVNENYTRQLLTHIANLTVHVSSDDRTFWDNKSAAFVDSSTEETLVLSSTHYMIDGILYNH